MRSSIIVAALLAPAALSKPIFRRKYKTEHVLVTVTTTVTVPPAAFALPTSTAPGEFFTPSSVDVPAIPFVTTTSEAPYVAPEPTTTTTVEEPAPATEAPVETPTPEVEVTATIPEPEVSVAVAATATSTLAAVVTNAAAVAAPATDDYQGTVLTQHNIHRANHSAPDLVWDDELASIAQTIASSCVYAHDTDVGGGGYGQNIGAGAPETDIGAMITNSMYNGEYDWYPKPFGTDNPDMSDFEHWGHFSQIVWKSTTSIGCATVKCDTLVNTGGNVAPYFTVCNYKPPGNFAGEYSNVGNSLGQKTVTV